MNEKYTFKDINMRFKPKRCEMTKEELNKTNLYQVRVCDAPSAV